MRSFEEFLIFMSRPNYFHVATELVVAAHRIIADWRSPNGFGKAIRWMLKLARVRSFEKEILQEFKESLLYKKQLDKGWKASAPSKRQKKFVFDPSEHAERQQRITDLLSPSARMGTYLPSIGNTKPHHPETRVGREF